MTTARMGAAMAFEWTKLYTLRSMRFSLLAYLALSVAVGVLTGVFVGRAYAHKPAPDGFDSISAGFSGLRLGMIALVVFSVLIVSSEYSSGTIRSSLTVVPRRDVHYAAKLLTGASVALAVSLVAVLASFFGTQGGMGAESVSLTDDGVARSLVGAVLYTTLLCVFSMGVASLLRSPVLTLGILLPLFFTVSTVLSNLPGVREVAQFLPDVAGGLVLYRHPPGDTVLGAWTGLGVLGLWTAASVAAGYWAMRRRDV